MATYGKPWSTFLQLEFTVTCESRISIMIASIAFSKASLRLNCCSRRRRLLSCNLSECTFCLFFGNTSFIFVCVLGGYGLLCNTSYYPVYLLYNLGISYLLRICFSNTSEYLVGYGLEVISCKNYPPPKQWCCYKCV